MISSSAILLASAGGDVQQALDVLHSAQEGGRAAPARISFRDHLTGTTVTVSSPHIPWLPDEQAALAQVTRPLQLMKAADSSFKIKI